MNVCSSSAWKPSNHQTNKNAQQIQQTHQKPTKESLQNTQQAQHPAKKITKTSKTFEWSKAIPRPSGAIPRPSPGAHAAVRHPPGSAPRGPGLLPSRLWGRHGARLRALGFNGEIMECSYGIWVIYGWVTDSSRNFNSLQSGTSSRRITPSFLS